MRVKRFFKGLILALSLVLSVSFMNVKPVVAAQGDAEDWTNYALQIKTFYTFNTAYGKILELTDVTQKNVLLSRLVTISDVIWTPEVKTAVGMLAQVCELKDGKTYADTEAYLRGLSSSTMDIMTQGYLLGELTGWGRAFVYTQDYIAGVGAVVQAWQTKQSTDITSAENTIKLVVNQRSRDYLAGELNNLKNYLGQNGLKVHYINVGQADSILLQQGSHAMLIDGGNNADAQTVKSYIDSQGITSLDYVVGTHSHEDHIGGLDYIINSFKVGKVYFPNDTATTQTFIDFANAVRNKGLQLTAPVPGETFKLGDATCTVLAPNGTGYSDANNSSIVLKVQYGKNSFLFTGDAETLSENEMLSKGYNLKADVLKIGHHGSDSSTSDNFLRAVSPKYAVISVGANNEYGHPALSTMEKLLNSGVTVYRTDLNRTVVATSNGENISFSCQTGTGKTPVTPPTTSITAIVDNPTPAQNATVHVIVNGPAGATVNITCHYKSTDTPYSGTTDAYGKAVISVPIGRASIGYKVVIDVTVSYNGQTYRTQTSFTPQ